ncbi:MarR family winged helix-turn-helix transcriptional regulator [Arcobacter sp.]|uniref:MarR family winged helix-turn-helix transcriptional regulator n=1 Tax=unclassified Arcobacter TaxID=2593671 RepID=UPI003B00AE5D
MSESCETIKSCETINNYLECCLFFTSNTMSRLINKMTEDAFMSTGLAPSYAFLMMVVIEKESIGIGELANVLKLAPSTVTRFVDKLILKNYLKREQVGRNMTITATSKGKALLPSIKESWKRLFNTYCDILGEEFAIELTSNMAKANKFLENK